MDSARLRELIALVVEDFTSALVRTTSSRLAMDDIAVLTYLREAFIAGGVERIEALLNAERWLQVGLRFSSEAQCVRFLAEARLAERARAWLHQGRIRHVFFMNKPPGMRLRLCGPRIHGEVGDELIAYLRDQEQAGRLEGHELGVYDEETYQFGGEVGMPVFHAFSTGDSLAILDLFALWAQQPDALDPMTVSLLVTSDLVRKIAGDRWEQWDVWCAMKLTGRGIDVEGPLEHGARQALEANRALLEAVVFRPDEIIAELGDHERRIVSAWFEHNTAVAQALAQAARSGRLLYGIRKIVPFYIIFHWNRLRMDMTQQVTMTLLMRGLLDPRADGAGTARHDRR